MKSADAIHVLFPFYLRLDRDLRLVEVGPSLRRMLPQLSLGAKFDDQFIISRPMLDMTYDNLAAHPSVLFSVMHLASGETLNGEILEFDDEYLEFLGQPVVRSLEDIQRLGLSIGSFSTASPIIEYVCLLQTAAVITQESERIQASLEADRRSLKSALSRLEDMNQSLHRTLLTKDEFLATMSHELRTPLAVILGSAEILLEEREGPLEPKTLAGVHAIDRSGKFLMSLLSDLFDTTRLRIGDLSLEVSDVSMEEIIMSGIELVAFEAQRKSIRLNVHVTPRSLLCRGDARRFTQIVTNLLSNAIKHTGTDGRVTADACLEAENLIVTVKDTGIGISACDQKRIFEPFVRIDRPDRGVGIGLGLYLVDQLVQLHGGRVEVSSELGKGSRFTCIFPQRRSADSSILSLATDS